MKRMEDAADQVFPSEEKQLDMFMKAALQFGMDNLTQIKKRRKKLLEKYRSKK